MLKNAGNVQENWARYQMIIIFLMVELHWMLQHICFFQLIIFIDVYSRMSLSTLTVVRIKQLTRQLKIPRQSDEQEQ